MPVVAMLKKQRAKTLGRRVVSTFGCALILAGLGVLVYFLWQYFGTNIVSKNKHADIRNATVLKWDKGIDADTIGLLRVQRFGDDYEVPIVPGFDKTALARGVGLYEKGAKPGEIGNFAIAGHRVTHGEPFRDFLELRNGDEIVVETRTKTFTYVLRNNGDDIRVDFTTSWPLQAVPELGKAKVRATEPLLTMMTCAELFNTRDRSVVVGDLAKTVDKKTGTTTLAKK